MHIIKVPAVFTCKLPGGEWLNLALIRRLQTEGDPPAVVITWENGQNQFYYGDKARSIIEAWSACQGIDKSEVR
jgi:hypothetical protein